MSIADRPRSQGHVEKPHSGADIPVRRFSYPLRANTNVRPTKDLGVPGGRPEAVPSLGFFTVGDGCTSALGVSERFVVLRPLVGGRNL